MARLLTTRAAGGLANNAGGGSNLTGTLNEATTPWETSIGNTSNSLSAIHYANGYFVSTGDSGVIQYTTDISTPALTTTWSLATSNTTNILHEVKYNGTHWVVVGRSGTIRYTTSPNVSWSTPSSVPTTQNLYAVTWSGTYWVAVGANGTILYASDASGTWTAATSNTTEALWDVDCVVSGGTDTYVAVGSTGHITTASVSSANAPTTWTQASNSNTSEILYAVQYANGYWIATGQTSSDGRIVYTTGSPSGTWTTKVVTTSGATPFYSLGWTGYYWIAFTGGSSFYYTTNVTGTWTVATGAISSYSQPGFTFSSSDYVITVGETGAIRYARKDIIPTSSQVYVMAVSVRAAATQITDPSGWTLLNSASSGTTLGTKLYWTNGAAISAWDGQVVIGGGSAPKGAAVIIGVADVNGGQPKSTQFSGQANSSSTTVTYPTLGTFSSVAGMDLVFGGYAHLPTPAAPTDYTQRKNTASSGGGGNSNVTVAAANRDLNSPVTTVGQLTASWTGTSAVNTGFHVFIENIGYAIANAGSQISSVPSYKVVAQAVGLIRSVVYRQGLGLASIFTTSQSFGQANAAITRTHSEVAHVQAMIYIHQYARPIEDVLNLNWLRVEL